MVRKRRLKEEPAMSDRLLLLSVEDLIQVAFGTTGGNAVNFNMIQTVLLCLAGQLRILEQEVEIKVDEFWGQLGDRRPIHKTKTYGDESVEVESRGGEREGEKSGDREGEEISEREGEEIGEREGEKSGEREGEKSGEREGGKEEGRELSSKDKHDTVGSKDRDRAEKGSKERKGGKGKDRGERGGESGKDQGGEREGEERGRDKGKKSKRDRQGADRDGRSADREGRDADRDERGADRDEQDADRDDDHGGHRGRHRGRERAGKRSSEQSEDRGERETGGKGGKRGADRDGRDADSDDDRGRHRGRERGGKRSRERSEDRGERETGGKGGKRGAYRKGTPEGAQRGVGREGSRTSITITEAERKGGKGPQDKILVVEKRPTSRSDARISRVGSIDAVGAAQFARLEKAVKELMSVAGPLPMPTLPEDEELRKDLLKGTASLSDTMDAMQLTARVQAAEERLAKMAGLLTQLAVAGALPEEMTGSITQLQQYLEEAAEAAKAASVSVGVMTPPAPGGWLNWSEIEAASGDELARANVGDPAEMEHFIQIMKDSLLKEVSTIHRTAEDSADAACASSKAIEDKLNIALLLDQRISNLYQQTTDYAEQLAGFGSGVMTLVGSCQEQMVQMRTELKGGVVLVEQANSMAETSTIVELTEYYHTLVANMDTTLETQQSLTILQKQLKDEMKTIIECVEMLREQKADHDEVFDCLRDKADSCRISGIMHKIDFDQVRLDLQNRVALFNEKSMKQEAVWKVAIKELKGITDMKAKATQAQYMHDHATEEFRDIQETLQKLFILLGEPKASLVTRKLEEDEAVCGSSMATTLDLNYGMPLLPLLSNLEEPCLTTLKPLLPPDKTKHVCLRWAGGSHTLVGDNVTHEKADNVQLQDVPTKRYTGYGVDGRLYRLEEEFQPCLECNTLGTNKPEAMMGPLPSPTGAGGDQVPGRQPMAENAAGD